MGQKTVLKSIPAPISGFNARDSIDSMDLSYALELTNFIPKQKVESRDGYSSTSSGLHSAVESLFSWNSVAGALKLFGFSDHKVFDASSGAASEVTPTSITNNYWQGHQFRSQSVFVNGTDNPLKYTGSSLMPALFSLSGTGYTTGTPLIHIGAYKNRQYFAQKDSQSFWYGDVNQIDGASPALKDFDVGGFLPRGGYVMWAQSFTKSTGNTSQDFFVVCSSEGDILQYSGDYPGNAWALTSKWQVAAPLGRRSFVHVPGDLWILTKQGIISIGLLSQGAAEIEITAQVKDFWLTAVKYYGSVVGWEGVYYPQQGFTIINIPVAPASGGVGTYDHLIFTDSNFSPAKLTGLNGVCHCIGQNDWYFGGADGKVYKYGSTTNADGSNIKAQYQSPFSDFEIPGQQKHFTEIYALISTKQTIAIDVEVTTDYSELVLPDPPLIPSTEGLTWGDLWGGIWGGVLETSIKKFGVKAIGYLGSVKLTAQTNNGKLYLNKFLVRFHVGGEN